MQHKNSLETVLTCLSVTSNSLTHLKPFSKTKIIKNHLKICQVSIVFFDISPITHVHLWFFRLHFAGCCVSRRYQDLLPRLTSPFLEPRPPHASPCLPHVHCACLRVCHYLGSAHATLIRRICLAATTADCLSPGLLTSWFLDRPWSNKSPWLLHAPRGCIYPAPLGMRHRVLCGDQLSFPRAFRHGVSFGCFPVSDNSWYRHRGILANVNSWLCPSHQDATAACPCRFFWLVSSTGNVCIGV